MKHPKTDYGTVILHWARLTPHVGELGEKTEANLKPSQDTGRGRPVIRNRAAHAAPGTSARLRASRQRSPKLQSNPLVVAAAVAIAGASIVVATDRLAVDHPQVHCINSAD